MEQDKLDEKAGAQAINADFSQVSSLAAGLIRNDLYRLPFFLIALAIPSILASQSIVAKPDFGFALALAERAIYLGCLFLLVKSWLNRLGAPTFSASANLKCLTKLFLFGYMIWSLIAIPMVAQLAPIAVELKLFFLLMLLVGGSLILTYFFYFFPAINSAMSWKEIALISKELSGSMRLAALKCLAAPMGIASLLMSLALAPSPDGRMPIFLIMADGFQSLFWVLSSYLSLAFCLRFLPEKEWERSKLDHYRQARLTTLAVQGPAWLSAILAPRGGLTALFVSAFIWGGNAVQISTLAPSPEIKLIESEISGKNVILKLGLSDEQFQFKGFLPMHFALAGNNRELVAAQPSKLKVNGEKREMFFGFAPNTDKAEIELTFRTERQVKELTALEDLNLWYRHFKVMHLDLKNARILEPPAAK